MDITSMTSKQIDSILCLGAATAAAYRGPVFTNVLAWMRYCLPKQFAHLSLLFTLSLKPESVLLSLGKLWRVKGNGLTFGIRGLQNLDLMLDRCSGFLQHEGGNLFAVNFSLDGWWVTGSMDKRFQKNGLAVCCGGDVAVAVAVAIRIRKPNQRGSTG